MAAVNEMIEANMPFVVVLWADYKRRNPHHHYLEDEMLSTGFEELVTAVQKIHKKVFDVPDKITAYLRKWINGAFVKGYAQSQLLPINRQHFAKRKAAGKPIQVLKQVSLPNIERHKLDKEGEVDPRDVLIIWDELNASCLDDIDRTIVRMRASGNHDEEIADYLGVGRTFVQVRRKKIEQRYYERQND